MAPSFVGSQPSPTSGLWIPVQFPSAAPPGEAPVMLTGRVIGFGDGERHPALLLLHPNPAHGGTMDNKILRAIADALYVQGVGGLRYNSRGVGGSEGEVFVEGQHSGDLTWVEGSRETADIGAALTYLVAQPWIDPTRIALVGFSFGSRIALSYLADHPDAPGIRAVVAVGFPLAARDLSHLGRWPGPKLFITGDQDEFCPPDQLAAFVETLPPPALRAVIKGVGHFLPGRELTAGMIAAHFLTPILGAAG